MAYLSTAEYIARFGERETTILTNETPGAGTYDSAKVDGAIEDADEVVDGYIGTRYVTPVANPPRILKGWTAAIARENLFITVGKTNDAVKQAADLARSQMKDVQSNKMGLPIPEGSAALPTSGLGTAASSMDREAPTFAGTGALDTYLPPYGGAYSPCWRRGY